MQTPVPHHGRLDILEIDVLRRSSVLSMGALVLKTFMEKAEGMHHIGNYISSQGRPRCIQRGFNNDRACSHPAHLLLFIPSTYYPLYFTLSYFMEPELHDHTFNRTKTLDVLGPSPCSDVDTNHLDRREPDFQPHIEQG